MPPPYKLNVIVTNCPDIGGTVGNYDVQFVRNVGTVGTYDIQLVRWGHTHARPNFIFFYIFFYILIRSSFHLTTSVSMCVCDYVCPV